MIEQGHFHELVLILEKISQEAVQDYQRMVFSATLTLPRKKASNKKKKGSKLTGEESIGKGVVLGGWSFVVGRVVSVALL